MLNKIYEWISRLQTTPKSNDKKEIIKELLQLPDAEQSVFKLYLSYVYDEVNYTYGKSKLPPIPITPDERVIPSAGELFMLLDDLAQGVYRGKEADEAITDFLVLAPAYVESLFEYVLKRDIKAKVGTRMLNEVLGVFIKIAPYQRCESEDMLIKRIIYPALVQTKADGLFMNNECLPQDDEEYRLTTRYGKVVPKIKDFDKFSTFVGEVSKYVDPVLHGEFLVMKEDGTLMNRQTGNGLINKYVKKESTRAEMVRKSLAASGKTKEKRLEEIAEFDAECEYVEKNLVYKIWDILPSIEWNALYSSKTVIERFKEVINIYNQWVNSPLSKEVSFKVVVIDFEIVNNYEEAMEFYQKQLKKGEEGAVLKNLAATWEHDTNRQGIIKLKDFKECDLRIIGWEYGKVGGEFETGIGSLICESAEGQVKVNVSGMPRHVRGFERVDENDSSKGIKLIDGFDFDQYNGKIATVKYNELIKSKDSDIYSLFLPSIIDIREAFDKDQADDIKKIMSSK